MINSLQQKREFLGIKDITTGRQKENGTVIWRLPIKKHGEFIEVGSFESGYVRRMNGCYTPYQLNKTENYDHYYPEHKWVDNEAVATGKYNKHVGVKRILIPEYWDRLEYLMSYCLKNYFIKQANEDESERYTWSGGQITDSGTGDVYVHEQHAYWNKTPNSVSVIVDGHRYPVLVDGEKY